MQLRRIIFSTILTFITVIIIFFLRKSSVKHKPINERKVNIVSTTSMITDAVKRVGGERADVYGLMGPGVDPHLYRARAGDMQKLASADIVFYNGLHLEGKMADVFEQMKTRTITVPVTKGIMRNTLLRSEFSDVYDPHVWFDVQLWKEVVKVICDTFVQKDPIHENHYKNRTKSYLHELDMLNNYIKSVDALGY